MAWLLETRGNSIYRGLGRIFRGKNERRDTFARANEHPLIRSSALFSAGPLVVPVSETVAWPLD